VKASMKWLRVPPDADGHGSNARSRGVENRTLVTGAGAEPSAPSYAECPLSGTPALPGYDRRGSNPAVVVYRVVLPLGVVLCQSAFGRGCVEPDIRFRAGCADTGLAAFERSMG
jgi:hypothetical protein